MAPRDRQLGRLERLERLGPEGAAFYERLFADPDHVAGALGMMASWDLGGLDAALVRLRAALTLVAAADDGTVPPHHAARVVQRVREGRLVRVERGGHLLHEVEPVRVAKIVVDALSRAGLPSPDPNGIDGGEWGNHAA